MGCGFAADSEYQLERQEIPADRLLSSLSAAPDGLIGHDYATAITSGRRVD